jgi:hypothetical protein
VKWMGELVVGQSEIRFFQAKRWPEQNRNAP